MKTLGEETGKVPTIADYAAIVRKQGRWSSDACVFRSIHANDPVLAKRIRTFERIYDMAAGVVDLPRRPWRAFQLSLLRSFILRGLINERLKDEWFYLEDDEDVNRMQKHPDYYEGRSDTLTRMAMFLTGKPTRLAAAPEAAKRL